jgi:hypothetical protein
MPDVSGAGSLIWGVMHEKRMETRWHLKAFAALGIALLCLVVEQLFRGQGYYTFQAYGGEFGFARIKSLTFVVWQGEIFRFPFDGTLFLIAAASVGLAIYVARRHFRARRTSA